MARTSKQQQIDALMKELDEAYRRISKMQKEADESFQNSPLFREMSERIHFYELVEKTSLFSLESSIRKQLRSEEECRMLYEDNVALCSAHDSEYWLGMTEISRWDKSNIRSLEKEIETLQAKVQARDTVIEHLKDVIAGKEIGEPTAKKTGRKPVPKETVVRIRKYRRDGYSVREIAEMEGVSIGFVSQSCRNVKRKKSGE